MKRGVHIAIVLAGAGIIAAGIILALHSRSAHKPAAKEKAASSINQKPLDPLQIAAIRKRSYPGSAITIIKNEGDQGGYQNQIISYQSDGLEIYALLSTPDSPAPAGGYPVIILDHGYINPTQYQTDGGDYHSWIATFARAGFVVVKPDYRGNGQSQGVPEGGHYSPVYAYDNLNLIASLKKFPLVNSSRLGLVGHSLGGHVALRTIVVSPDIKATVLANGVVGSLYDLFYNWPHSPAPHDQPTVVVQGALQKLIATHGDPKSNPAFWDAASAINYVNAVTGPVQIHHDQADSTVPYLFAQHLDAALKKAGKPDEFYTYPGDNHQLQGEAQALFLQRSLSFFQAHL
jgi:dipeptidyl aminopeptidase/acylaminoacyl peptidase